MRKKPLPTPLNNVFAWFYLLLTPVTNIVVCTRVSSILISIFGTTAQQLEIYIHEIFRTLSLHSSTTPRSLPHLRTQVEAPKWRMGLEQ